MDLRRPHNLEKIFEPLLFGVFALGVLMFLWGFGGGAVRHVIGALFGMGALLVLYGTFIEPRLLSVAKYREALVPEPTAWVRFVWVSDLHAGGFRKREWYERVAMEVQSLDPDIFVMGGDFVAGRVEPVHLLKPFARVTAHIGRYFVLGNHDFLDQPTEIRRTLLGWGFGDITNTHLSVMKRGKVLQIFGVDDCWYGAPRMSDMRAEKKLPHVTLSHEPDVALDLTKEDTDLVLCGHTHGGQIRLPLIGSLAPIPSILGRLADRGRRVVNGVPLIISQGLGESDMRPRLFCRPEIVVVEVGI